MEPLIENYESVSQIPKQLSADAQVDQNLLFKDRREGYTRRSFHCWGKAPDRKNF